MTEFEEYQEHIQSRIMLFAGLLFAMRLLTQPASCIQSGAGKSPLNICPRKNLFHLLPQINTLHSRRPVSSKEYPFSACGQTVMLSNPELAAALSSLPEMEQEIIFLYFFEHLTHNEIGMRYGRTRSTAGRHIYLDLCRLREEMEVLSHE